VKKKVSNVTSKCAGNDLRYFLDS